MRDHHKVEKVFQECCKLDDLGFMKKKLFIRMAKYVFNNQQISIEHIERFDYTKKFGSFVKNHVYDKFEKYCIEQITKLPV